MSEVQTEVKEKKKSLFQSGEVFSRVATNAPIISAKMYNLIIGAVLVWGFIINAIMVWLIPVNIIASIDPFIFFLGYFALCIGGITLFNKSDNPAISFLGYNLVVVPFGLVINMVVSGYDSSIVLNSIIVTGVITGIMMFLAAINPDFFIKLSYSLPLVLLVVLIVELIGIFVFRTHPTVFDWAVVIIFAGYIGIDWTRANSIPKTVDNAIDAAAAIYMDIINIFLRLLGIMGKKD